MVNKNPALLRTWQWCAGEGRHLVVLTLLDTGAGMNGFLTGGEAPHVGGVVMAVPRISLTGNGWSADNYSLPVPGHKDCEVALPMATELAKVVKNPIVISAGIHSDDLTPDELALIMDHCHELTTEACRVLLATGF